jgi:hypothetical protein
MPHKLRLYDLKQSGLPAALGMCAENTNGLASIVNAAQRRLLYAKESGEEGWWSTFAEIRFQASRATPYITMSREIARLELIDVCGCPVPLRNSFYEYLQYGNGRMPNLSPWRNWNRYTQGFTRNNAVTFVDPLPAPNPFFLKIFITNAADASGALRILLQGTDSTGSTIYTQDGYNPTVGQFVPFAFPFAIAPMEMSSITGIQKDVTAGAIQIFQSDPAGVIPDKLLLTMEPGETTANYRRYYLDHLPCWCCQPPPSSVPQPVTVNAIAKLDLVPVAVDTDTCLIQNQEALILECQAVRMSKMDTQSAAQKAAEYHQEAIRLLNGELTHFLGKDNVAVRFSPFGSADLRRVRIGMR